MQENSILGQNPAPISKKKSKLPLIGLVISIVVVISSVSLILLIQSKNQNPYKKSFASIQKTQDFPLLYPKKTSPEFPLQSESISSTSGLVSSLYKSGNNTIVVIQQKKSDNLDSNILSGSKDVNVSKGKAYVTELGDKPRGIIITDKTMVSISGSGDTNEATLVKFIENF